MSIKDINKPIPRSCDWTHNNYKVIEESEERTLVGLGLDKWAEKN